jgi:hypothetical protein
VHADGFGTGCWELTDAAVVLLLTHIVTHKPILISSAVAPDETNVDVFCS